MLQRLKKSSLGKWMYRASRLPGLGLPLRVLSRMVQIEALQIAHLKPRNRAHNRRQRRILSDFVQGSKQGAKREGASS